MVSLGVILIYVIYHYSRAYSVISGIQRISRVIVRVSKKVDSKSRGSALVSELVKPYLVPTSQVRFPFYKFQKQKYQL